MTPATILKTLKNIEMAAYGGDINGWVCRKVFMDRTGLDTDDKLYHFRKEHPDLVKIHEGKREFIYNLPGWFELFKPVGKAS